MHVRKALQKKQLKSQVLRNCNVNIMNEDGIIIASVDPKRVSTFHEAAYVITHNRDNVIMVEDPRKNMRNCTRNV